MDILTDDGVVDFDKVNAEIRERNGSIEKLTELVNELFNCAYACAYADAYDSALVES